MQPSLMELVRRPKLDVSNALVFMNGSVVLWPPQECRCGRMASFFKNVDGETRCLECVRLLPDRRGKRGKGQ